MPVCTRGMGARAVGPAEAGTEGAVGRIGVLEGALRSTDNASWVHDTQPAAATRSWRPGEKQGFVDTVPQFWTEDAQGQVCVGG